MERCLNQNSKAWNFADNRLILAQGVENILGLHEVLLAFQVEDCIYDSIAYEMIVDKTEHTVIVLSQRKLWDLFDFFFDFF